MTDRRHIRPAHPDATIPDPARGRDLPAEGAACTWSVHWARLAARGDVVVTEVEAETDVSAPTPSPAEAEAAPAEPTHPDA